MHFATNGFEADHVWRSPGYAQTLNPESGGCLLANLSWLSAWRYSETEHQVRKGQRRKVFGHIFPFTWSTKRRERVLWLILIFSNHCWAVSNAPTLKPPWHVPWFLAEYSFSGKQLLGTYPYLESQTVWGVVMCSFFLNFICTSWIAWNKIRFSVPCQDFFVMEIKIFLPYSTFLSCSTFFSRVRSSNCTKKTVFKVT